MRSNDELEKLMRTEDVVKYIRAQRIKCWGKLNRMEKKQKQGERLQNGMRSKWRPKYRWKDEVVN